MKGIKNSFSFKGVTAKVSVVVALASAIAGADVAFADQILYAKKKHPVNAAQPAEGLLSSAAGSAWVCDNWKIESNGGLSYIHPQDADYFFKLSGALRFDETLFMGSKQDKGSNYPSGGNIRAAQLYMDGGVGKNWVYNLGLDFAGSTVGIDNAYLSYFGLVENNQIYVGKLSGNFFGLDGSNSTSWNPFLERSLQNIAFYPGDGLGVSTDFWWKDGGLTLSATQPDQTDTTGVIGKRDRWLGLARATFAPVHEEGDVWHFGMSGAYHEIQTGVTAAAPSAGVAFQAAPSARARNVKGSTSLINTTLGNGNAAIAANNLRLFNIEMARQYGPFMFETEYTHAFVHRSPISGSTTPFLGSLGFHGWNLQTRYMLTGESHAYDVRNGNFGSVKATGPYGAIEVAARYDYINLNDKDVNGGSEHNGTLGLNWYLNSQVRLSTNYVRANIRPANNAPKSKLDIIGLRCQVRFY
ncbi:MAG: hypothetical protein KBD23_03595 [Gammaproteobacteria bacterium]|nr:hypothetical protein [Gammaproteobacteria bacterium]